MKKDLSTILQSINILKKDLKELEEAVWNADINNVESFLEARGQIQTAISKAEDVSNEASELFETTLPHLQQKLKNHFHFNN